MMHSCDHHSLSFTIFRSYSFIHYVCLCMLCLLFHSGSVTTIHNSTIKSYSMIQSHAIFTMNELINFRCRIRDIPACNTCMEYRIPTNTMASCMTTITTPYAFIVKCVVVVGRMRKYIFLR